MELELEATYDVADRFLLHVPFVQYSKLRRTAGRRTSRHRTRVAVGRARVAASRLACGKSQKKRRRSTLAIPETPAGHKALSFSSSSSSSSSIAAGGALAILLCRCTAVVAVCTGRATGACLQAPADK